MGMPIPAQNDAESSRSDALQLMNQKELIEAQLDHQYSLLRMNESTMTSPILDAEGFPRADIDLVVVRSVRVVQCNPDLEALYPDQEGGLRRQDNAPLSYGTT